MSNDGLWSAIGDPTRRQLLDLLLESGSGTASSLSEELPVSRQAVSKHLVVLERVDLVHSTAIGRERIYQPDHAQLARAVEQVAIVGSRWDGRLRCIARIAEDLDTTKQQQLKQIEESGQEGEAS